MKTFATVTLWIVLGCIDYENLLPITIGIRNKHLKKKIYFGIFYKKASEVRTLLYDMSKLVLTPNVRLYIK